MTVLPAQVAGVPNIRVVSPQPRAEVLAAAAMLGVEEFYRIGGAQAIAALAYGTQSVKRVDKIVGPGNVYVTAAKKLVAFDCAIDFLAGPTEVVILSHDGKAGFIAADLVAQAEHDTAGNHRLIDRQHEAVVDANGGFRVGTGHRQVDAHGDSLGIGGASDGWRGEPGQSGSRGEAKRRSATDGIH